MFSKIAASIMLVLSLSGTMPYGTGIAEEQMEASGAYELQSALPDDVQEQMDDLGLELKANGIGDVSAAQVLDSLTEMAAESSRGPLRACLAALSVMAVCSAASVIAERRGSSLMTTYDTLSAAAAVLCVCVPCASFIDFAAGEISSLCKFSAILMPVLSGLAYVTGHAATAAACSGFTLTVIEVINVMIPAVLVPALRILLGISVIGSLCGSFELGKLCESVEKNIKWLLGIMGVLLSGVLGVSAVAAGAADSAAVKGSRFIISGSVPVVGGAISDSIGTIINCVGIVRTSVGSFGLVAAMFIVLPAALTAVLWQAALGFASWSAKAFGCERQAAAMRALGSVISLTLGAIAFVTVVLTVGTALMIILRSE